ncbi:MAG: exosortase-associated EpsI family protein [Verrucomicrobiota bacterium]|nr:exosortase-associated EpsI family protein [Verrucomicrobiota bacterium]
MKVVQEELRGEDGQVIANQCVWLPPQVDGTLSRAFPITKAELEVLPPDTTFGRRLYSTRDGFSVFVNVVLMGTDRTSIHKPQYCMTGSGWTIDETEIETVPIPKPYPYDLKVTKMTMSMPIRGVGGKPAVRKGVFLYWFVAENQLTPYHGERMWWMARDLVQKGTLQRWAYIIYFSDCQPGQEEVTFNRLKSFVAQTLPEFQITAGQQNAHHTPKQPDALAVNK